MVGATNTRNVEMMTIRARDGFLLHAMSSSRLATDDGFRLGIRTW